MMELVQQLQLYLLAAFAVGVVCGWLYRRAA